MVLSLKEKKEQGLYCDDDRFVGTPYANGFISSFLWFLYLRDIETPNFCEFIELCGRNFEISRYAPDFFDGFRSTSVDLKEQDPLGFCTNTYYEDPFDEDTATWGFSNDGRCHDIEEFNALEKDTFSYKLPISIRMYSDEDRDDFLLAIYCRPPSQKPMNQFPGSLEQATQCIKKYVHERATKLGINVSCPGCLSVPEWYFALKSATLLATKTPSKAIIQIPVRLLNLAKAADGRKLLSALGLIESILVLPKTNQAASVETALVTLSDGAPGRHVLFYDCRSFNSQSIIHSKVDLIIDSVESTWNSPHILDDKKHCFSPQIDDGICSLLPPELSTFFPRNCYTPLQSFCSIRRGTPRSAILKLEETSDNESNNELFFYVSNSTLPNGAEIKATDITCFYDKEAVPFEYEMPEDPYVDDADIYDLACVPKTKLHALKPLDVTKSNLLISRVGTPFQVTLISDAYVIYDGYEENYTAIASCGGIIPADNTIVVTIDDNEVALFLLAYLQSNEGQEALFRVAHGNKLTQLSTRDLRNMKVPYPSPKERDEIIERYKRKQSVYSELECKIKRQGELIRNLQAD